MSMRKTLFSIATALLCFTGCTSVPKTCEQPYEPIQIAVPERPAGQQDAVGLTAPKIDTVRVGFIGVGMRGISAVERWTHIPGVQIKALCDLRPELVEKAQKTLVSSGMPEAATYWNCTHRSSVESKMTNPLSRSFCPTPVSCPSRWAKSKQSPPSMPFTATTNVCIPVFCSKA